jgi:hypothetical protein
MMIWWGVRHTLINQHVTQKNIPQSLQFVCNHLNF